MKYHIVSLYNVLGELMDTTIVGPCPAEILPLMSAYGQPMQLVSSHATHGDALVTLALS